MLEPGSTIALGAGLYTLRARLGASAYGQTWRADGPHGQAAIKLVNTERMRQCAPAQHRHWHAHAARELRFLRSLPAWERRHLVGLLDHGEHGGLPALALELLDGDLAAHLAAHPGPQALPLALRWMAQINAALACVHRHGWRHLDLKPANLLLDRAHARLKLADFGTCRALADRRPHCMTGTAAWQAPEQRAGGAGGQLTDARSDYYALGLLFFVLVRGCLPTAGQPDASALTVGDEEGFAATFDSGHPGAAGPALALLRALLAPHPARRPPHALAISRALQAIGVPGTPWNLP